MKKYEYVSIKLKNNVVKDATQILHRSIIDDYALRGFRYCGYVPTRLGQSGKVIEMDLIFETEA